MFFSAIKAGYTHDLDAFQYTKLADVIGSNVLPPWAVITADDTYRNGCPILSTYRGRRLTQEEASFNYYLSSARISVEQEFGILVNRFGIL